MSEQVNILIDDGGPAYPSRLTTTLRGSDGRLSTTMVEEGEPGMSLRAYFAGQALAGLMACPQLFGEPEEFAKNCVAMADALIAALKKG